MTRDEAATLVIEGMNYAAYRETDSSLYDSDKNRLFGSDHYNSGRVVMRPSPWAEGNFEKKMATLLVWAIWLNSSSPDFAEAQKNPYPRRLNPWACDSEGEAAAVAEALAAQLAINPHL